MSPAPWFGDSCAEQEAPTPTVYETDNPIVHVLYGPDGEPLRLWRERPPFGFRNPQETP